MGDSSGGGLEGVLAEEVRVIARGAGVAFVGNTAGKALGLVSTFLLGRALGSERFGVFQLALSLVSVAGIIAMLGLDTALPRYLGIYRGQGDAGRIRGTVLSGLVVGGGLSAALCAVLLLTCQGLAHRVFPRMPQLDAVLWVMALTVPLVCLAQLATSVAQGFQAMGYVNLIASGALRGGLLVTGVVIYALHRGEVAAAQGYLCTTAVGALVGLWVVWDLAWRRTPPARPVVSPWPLLAFSAPLAVSGLLVFAENYADRLLLGAWSRPAEVGRYSVAYSVAQVLATVLVALNLVFAPTAAKLYAAGRRAELVRLYKAVAKWTFAGTLPLTILLISVGGPVLGAVGPDFRAGRTALAVLSAAALVNAATGSTGLLIMMSGRSVLEMVNTLIAGLISVGLNLWLIPRYGAVGAATGTGSALALVNFIRIGQAVWLFKAHPYRADFWKPALAGLVAWAVPAAVWRSFSVTGPDWRVAVGYAALVIGTYAAVMWACRISEEDRFVLGLVGRKLGLGKEGGGEG